MDRVSKELVSTVLGKNAYWICNGSPENRIGYSGDSSAIGGRSGFKINTYEFIHMCKEWTSEEITYHNGTTYVNLDIGEGGYVYDHMIENKSEVDGVIQACEWLLKEKR